jgi:uncharacterized membrane protein YkvI
MTIPRSGAASSWIQRFLLPGFAFKAVVIGGGYATGRELAEFFLPSGPAGGLLAILVATGIWSLVCALTFSYAYTFRLFDYRAFFEKLLGRGWIIFEVIYLLFVVLILSVFGATTGAIGHALFGWPVVAGAVILLLLVAAVVAIGARAVEPLFKYVSVLLYLTYAAFLVLSLWRFGPSIPRHLMAAPPGEGWFLGGVSYAGYNAVAAVVILPVLRHQISHKEAVIAGVIAGPLAMIPALFFFLSMIAWYPGIESSTLPSDFLLLKIGFPGFRLVYQAMIFFALLESGCGSVHAIMERVRHAALRSTGKDVPVALRGVVTAAVLATCVFVAQRFGLVDLIGKGYRFMSWIIIAIFIVPIVGVFALKLRPASVRAAS